MVDAKRLRVTVIFVFVFMAAYALSMGMYSTLLPHIISFYGTNFKESSWFSITNDVGNLLAMGFTIVVVDKVNKNTLLGIMSILLGGIMVLIGTAPVLIIFLMMRIVLGMTGSVVDSLCAAYISDLYGEERSKYISILHMIYGIGSLLGPQYVFYTITHGSTWNMNYLLLGFVMVVTGGIFFVVKRFVKSPATAVAKVSGEKKKIPYLQILRSRNMIILCIASFLLSGSIYFNTWLPTYLTHTDAQTYTEGVRSMIMTLYFVGMIFSRMIYAAISKKLKADTYLKYSNILVVIILATALAIQSVPMWYAANLLVGLIGGTAYTAKFILACSEFPEYSATAIAMTGVMAALGSMTMNAVGGAVADAGSFTTAMCIPLVSFAAVSVLLFAGYNKKKPQQEA